MHVERFCALRRRATRSNLLSRDLDDWRITFVDTGLHSNLGQRLLKVRKYLGDDEEFMANYSDGLSDMPLDQHLAEFRRQRVTASFVAVPSPQSFHALHGDDHGIVTSFGRMKSCELLDQRWLLLPAPRNL